jgi:hypothetical protein
LNLLLALGWWAGRLATVGGCGLLGTPGTGWPRIRWKGGLVFSLSLPRTRLHLGRRHELQVCPRA